jgi:hypothetical protein
MQLNPSKLANRAHRVNGPIRRGARQSSNPPTSAFGANPAPAPPVPGANAVVPLASRGIPEMSDSQGGLPQFAQGGVVSNGRYLAPPTSPWGPTEIVDHPQIRNLGTDQAQAVVPLKAKPTSRVRPSQVPGLIQKYSGR